MCSNGVNETQQMKMCAGCDQKIGCWDPWVVGMYFNSCTMLSTGIARLFYFVADPKVVLKVEINVVLPLKTVRERKSYCKCALQVCQPQPNVRSHYFNKFRDSLFCLHEGNLSWAFFVPVAIGSYRQIYFQVKEAFSASIVEPYVLLS